MNQMFMPIYLTLMEKGNLAPLHLFFWTKGFSLALSVLLKP